jgi:hypothetical protein
MSYTDNPADQQAQAAIARANEAAKAAADAKAAAEAQRNR